MSLLDEGSAVHTCSKITTQNTMQEYREKAMTATSVCVYSTTDIAILLVDGCKTRLAIFKQACEETEKKRSRSSQICY